MKNTRKGFGDISGILIAAFVGIIVASVALVIGAGINDQTTTVIKTVVTDPSASFNTTVLAAGTMLSTSGSFGQIVAVALFGGLALYALLSSMGSGTMSR